MQMTIAIRGDVADEVEAQTVLKAIDDAIVPLTTNDLEVKASIKIDVKPAASPP